jgi:hypothetical protein
MILRALLPITVPPGSKRDQAEFKKNGAKLLSMGIGQDSQEILASM